MPSSTNHSKSVPATDIQVIIKEEKYLNDFQPLYRHPLLQNLYSYARNSNANGNKCKIDTDLSKIERATDANFDDIQDIFEYVSVVHGQWIPSQRYLEEAADFSWADYTPFNETSNIVIQNITTGDTNIIRNKRR